MGNPLPWGYPEKGVGSTPTPTSWAHAEVKYNQDTALQRGKGQWLTSLLRSSCRRQNMHPDCSPPGTRGHLPNWNSHPPEQMHKQKEGEEKLSPQLACGSVGELGNVIALLLYSKAAHFPIPPDSEGVPGSSARKPSLSRGEGEPNLGHHSLCARIRWGPRPAPVMKQLLRKVSTGERVQIRRPCARADKYVWEREGSAFHNGKYLSVSLHKNLTSLFHASAHSLLKASAQNVAGPGPPSPKASFAGRQWVGHRICWGWGR